MMSVPCRIPPSTNTWNLSSLSSPGACFPMSCKVFRGGLALDSRDQYGQHRLLRSRHAHKSRARPPWLESTTASAPFSLARTTSCALYKHNVYKAIVLTHLPRPNALDDDRETASDLLDPSDVGPLE
jgi:hypothetical protein